MSMSPETPATSSYVTRFFGGPPLSVIFRLLLLSLLIGVILEVLGLDPKGENGTAEESTEQGPPEVALVSADPAAEDPEGHI